MKIYFLSGGGLGDNLFQFFTGEMAYAEDIKEKYPDTEIIVICRSSNASIEKVFEYNPIFDKILLVSPLGDEFQNTIDLVESQGYVYWSKVFNHLDLKKKLQKIYLTQDEESFVKDLTKQGKYLLVHPFNSAGTGICATHFEVNTDYTRIIQQVLDSGYKLIQVGSDWKHNPTGNIQYERFEYNHPNFINLVNKVSIRTIARLTMLAYKFIGTSSVWSVVATVNGVPSFCILPVHMADLLQSEAEKGDGLRGELITRYGMYYGAKVPELYDKIDSFLKADLPKRTIDFSEHFPKLV